MGSVISNQGQGQKSQCRWSPGSHGGGGGVGGWRGEAAHKQCLFWRELPPRGGGEEGGVAVIL